MVDAVFTGFELGERQSYVRFLEAHGRVVPAIEATLRHEGLPPWRPRTSDLARDLAAFGCELPRSLVVGASAGLAWQFGLLYVIEGSRLGGRLLLRRVGEAFSAQYLSAVHRPGEWRAFTAALDACAAAKGAAWLDAAVAGALHGFQLYAAAAAAVPPLAGRD